MSNTIDRRVVDMEFNNKQFESGIRTSMSSLEKFERALNLNGVGNGFKSLGNAVRSFTLDPLANAADTVSYKFDALRIMGVTALVNITNSAVNAGKQLVKSLSIDQITAGWAKFGSKTTSVATLVAQGNDLEVVNDQLDRLNWFTDETSYNFTDMVSNIAKFTASGKGLEESVTAMEGIATWAALSGQNAQTASNAMYQLSQAMGSGMMRKEDYKSIQNASMDTMEFRQKCIDAAIALGTLKDNGNGTYRSLVANVKDGDFSISQFADHLTQDAWFTSDVMMKVFNDYSSAVSKIYDVTEENGMLASEVIDQIHKTAEEGNITIDEAIEKLGYIDSEGKLLFDSFGLKAFEAAQKARTWADAVDSVKDAVSTGWMNTFEIIFGNSEEATELWTDLANAMWDVFASGGEARNEMLEGWKTLGGRTDLIESFWNVWNGVGEIVAPVKEAFRDIFPKTTSTQLMLMTASLKRFTSNLTISEETAGKVKQTFTGLFSVLDIVKQAVSAIASGFGDLLKSLSPVGNSFLDITSNLGSFLTNLKESCEESDLFTTIITQIKEAFVEMFPNNVVDKLVNFTESLKDLKLNLQMTPATADKVKRVFKGLFAIFNIVTQAISAVASGFFKLLGIASPLGGNFLDIAANIGDFLVKLSDAITQSEFFTGAMELIGSAVESVSEGIKTVLTYGVTLFEKLSSVDMSGISVKFEPLKALADAWTWVIEKLTVAWNAIKPLLISAGIYISAAFRTVSGAISEFFKDGGLDSINKVLSGGLISALIVGVTKITSLISGLGEKDGFLKNISDAVSSVTGSLEQMQNKLKTEVIKNIAISIGILAAALMVLSLVNQDNLGNAIAAITVMFLELIGAMKGLEEVTSGTKAKGMTKIAVQLIAFSVAILILAAAMAILASIDQNRIAFGLVAILTLIGMLGIVARKLSENEGAMIKGAGGLISFAIAIGVLALAVKLLGNMDIASIGKGLLALGGILAELAIVTKLCDFSSISGSAGLGLMGIAMAILILAGAMAIIGHMDLYTIIKGLIGIAGGILLLVLAAQAMPTEGMIQAGVALTLMSVAILLLAASIAIMGALGLETAISGILAMAGALAVLVIAANAMQGTLAGAAAILIMSVALVALGVALNILGALSLEEACVALITLAATLAVIGMAATALSTAIGPMIGLAAAVLLLSVAVGVGGLALTAFGAGLTAVGVGIEALVISIVASVVALVNSITTIAVDAGIAIVALADAITAAAPAVAEAINAIVNAVISVLANAITSLSAAILEVGPSLIELAGFLMLLGAAAAVMAPLAPLITATSAALVAFGVGAAAIAVGVLALAAALELLGLAGITVASSLTDIYNVINNMGTTSLSAVLSFSSLFNSAGEQAAAMILEGFSTGFSYAESVITSAIVTTMTGADFNAVAATVMANFSSGIDANGEKPVGSVQTVGNNMVTKMLLFKTSFYNTGYDIVSGLVNGINNNAYRAGTAAYNLGLTVKQQIESALDINSPSRVFKKIGMFCDIGLANGLTEFSSLASEAATNLGNSAIQPVRTLTSNALNDLSSMRTALRGTTDLASALDSNITNEQYIIVNHTFDDLTVKGVNDRNEFVAVANYSVEDMLTDLMRKGIRL